MIKPVREDLPLLHLGGTVKTQVFVAVNVEKLLQDVKHLCHLCEDERTMTARL